MELLGGYDSDSSCEAPVPARTGGRKRPLGSDAQSANAAVSSSSEQQAQRAAAASKQSRGAHASTDRFSAGGSSALSSILDGLPDVEMPANAQAQGPSRPPQQHSAAVATRSAPKPPTKTSARNAQQQAQWAHAQASAAAASNGGAPPSTHTAPPPTQQAPAASAQGAAAPQWAARLDKRTARELAALGMLPSGAPAPPSGDVAGGVTQPAVADVDSQRLYGNWDSQTALKGSLAVPDKRNVTIGYWNAHGEGATTTSAPTRGQKRKNQVNHVAAHFFRNENNYQAADAAAAAHKRSSRSKYGW